MPALLALPDLFALCVGLLCFLGAVALTYFIKAIASALPNLSILGVGLNLAKIFRDAGDDIMGWVVDNTKSLWHAFSAFITGHAYLIDAAFGAVVSAIVHHADQIAHLFTVEIPNAIRTAVGDAEKYTDGLIHSIEGDVATARRDIESTLSKEARAAYRAAAAAASSVDRDLKAAVATAVDHAEAFTTREVHNLDQVLSKAISDALAKAEQDIGDVKRTLGSEIASLAQTVAADYHAALGAAQADAAAALSTAKTLIGQARQAVEGELNTDITNVTNTLQSAIDTVSNTVTNLTSTVGQDLTTAENYAQAQVAAGLNDVVDTLNGTADVVGGAIGAAAAGVAGTIAGVGTQAAADAAGALGQAEDAVGSALQGIYDDITGQSAAYGGDLTGIAGLLGGAITGALAGVTARVAKLEQCSVGVCSDSPNNFSNLLQDALGLASVVGIGGFLAELIQHPAAAEQQYANVIEGTYNEGQSAFETLLQL